MCTRKAHATRILGAGSSRGAQRSPLVYAFLNRRSEVRVLSGPPVEKFVFESFWFSNFLLHLGEAVGRRFELGHRQLLTSGLPSPYFLNACLGFAESLLLRTSLAAPSGPAANKTAHPCDLVSGRVGSKPIAKIFWLVQAALRASSIVVPSQRNDGGEPKCRCCCGCFRCWSYPDFVGLPQAKFSAPARTSAEKTMVALVRCAFTEKPFIEGRSRPEATA